MENKELSDMLYSTFIVYIGNEIEKYGLDKYEKENYLNPSISILYDLIKNLCDKYNKKPIVDKDKKLELTKELYFELKKIINEKLDELFYHLSNYFLQKYEYKRNPLDEKDEMLYNMYVDFSDIYVLYKELNSYRKLE
jgi:hypothetical protein